MAERYEYWLRGPVAGIPAHLQPVAHALLQAAEESREILRDFPHDRLWERPAGMASVGFHLQHISGVVNRLFTYARGESLTDEQRDALAAEGKPWTDGGIDRLLDTFDAQVERALAQLKSTRPETLTETRLVGRQQLPSTVLGLLFHAAEHAQRHLGQMLVTAKLVAMEAAKETLR